jgi:hypothetical protein
VATALGTTGTDRAIVAYDGSFAAAPLTFYLPASVDLEPASPARIDELDVIGHSAQAVSTRLPAGVRLISSRVVDSYRVARFSLAGGWQATGSAIDRRAGTLVGPGLPGAAVLLQKPSA